MYQNLRAQVTLSFPDNRLALFEYLAKRFGFGEIDKVVASPQTTWIYQGLWDRFMEMKLAVGDPIYFPDQPEAVAQTLKELLALTIGPDWSSRIATDPDIFSGKPLVGGHRMRVIDVMDEIADGQSVEEILDGFPFLTKEDLAAAVRWIHAQA